ncbi:Uncharacterised protein [Mycobacterium tuberculosis]|nr:Uncharacterised protein [Mycobacterium tuberculosis]COX05535.1 Uncharacterised protein [Mycobacterium tuberculosis]
MPTVTPICATLSEVLAASANIVVPNTIPAAVTTIPVAANARMTLVRGPAELSSRMRSAKSRL